MVQQSRHLTSGGTAATSGFPTLDDANDQDKRANLLTWWFSGTTPPANAGGSDKSAHTRRLTVRLIEIADVVHEVVPDQLFKLSLSFVGPPQSFFGKLVLEFKHFSPLLSFVL